MIRKEVAEEKANEKDTVVEKMQTNAEEEEKTSGSAEVNVEAMDITPSISPTNENAAVVSEEQIEENDDDNGEVHIVSFDFP